MASFKADPTLVRGAGEMYGAAAKVDYSGFYKGVAAIGTYFKKKNDLANQAVADRPEGVGIEELPEEMRTKSNMAFFDKGKKMYDNAVKDLKLYPSFTKKYKEAVNTMNVVRTGFERVKNEIAFYADYKKNNWNINLELSKSVLPSDRDFLNSLILSENKMNATVEFDLEKGVTIMGPDGERISPADLPKPVLSTDGLATENILHNAINKQGYNSKIAGGNFNEDVTRTVMSNTIRALKAKGDVNSLKSLMYDSKFLRPDGKGGSISDRFIDLVARDMGLTAQMEEWRANEGAGATQEEYEAAYDTAVGMIWSNDVSDNLENRLINYLVAAARHSYDAVHDPLAGMSAKDKVEYYRNLNK